MKIDLSAAHLPKTMNGRLERFRQGMGIKQTVLSMKVGVTVNQWKNYENGRTPLPWSVFVLLWKTYALSPRWLALGEGDVSYPFPFLKSLLPRVAPAEHFSAVFVHHLDAIFKELARTERPSAIADLKAFLQEAEAGTVPTDALKSVAQFAHTQHRFSPCIVIPAGRAGAMTRGEKTALRAKAKAGGPGAPTTAEVEALIAADAEKDPAPKFHQ